MIAAAPRVEPPPGVGESLRRALHDFYEESWRLVLLNSLFSVCVLLVLVLALYVPPAIVLLVATGPLLAWLVAAAVIVVDEGSLTFVETAEALRRTWRRGLVLGAFAVGAVLLSVFAFGFYAGSGSLAWPLAVLVLYLLGLFALFQVVLWPLAVRSPERPLRDVARNAGLALVRRPGATTGFGIAVLLVNLAGLALGVLPFLMLTIAYTALAAARFTRGLGQWPA
jgi:hypothetical protein